MRTTFRNTYTNFTAGEAERITGVSTATQRDWRRRKYLPAGNDGWTQYDLHGLAHLLVMRVLQDRGIGPSVSSEIAEIAALRIEYFALSWVDAIEDTSGDFERIVKEAKRPRASWFVGWSNSPGDPCRFLIAWADGSSSFVNDLHQSFGGYSWEERYHGAIIVIDLQALGGLIVDRAGRPLVSVEVGDEG